MIKDQATFDVAIIGGGPAGLSAALYLGRARRRVAVIDAGAPRHAVTDGVHNYLTRDGTPPSEFRRIAWEELAQYPGVRRFDGFVEGLTSDDEGVTVHTAALDFAAEAVLLAVGVEDIFPEIEGFDTFWGKSVFLCPFCHGWEVRGKRFGLLSQLPGAMYAEAAKIFGGWTNDLTFFSNGDEVETDANVVTTRIARLLGENGTISGVELQGGDVVPIDVLFFRGKQQQVPLVRELGLTLNDAGYVLIDESHRTSRPRIWAAGDLTGQMTQQVVQAAAQGGMAGAMIFKSLVGAG